MKSSYQRDLSADDVSVVFSGWTSTLDLIARTLENHIQVVRIDGRLSSKERNTSLAAFHNRAEVRVLLVSLTCGAVGYTLLEHAYGVTTADTVYAELISRQPLVSI